MALSFVPRNHHYSSSIFLKSYATVYWNYLDSGTDDTNDKIATLLGSITSRISGRGPAVSTKLAFLELLLQKVNESEDEKVVLVSDYTTTLDLMERLLTSKGYPYLRLDGSTPPAKRQGLVDNNNSPAAKTFAFLLSAKAGGVGLDLVGASRLVLFDVDWNPATRSAGHESANPSRRPKEAVLHIPSCGPGDSGGEDLPATAHQDWSLGRGRRLEENHPGLHVRRAPRFCSDSEEGDSCPTHDLLGCQCGGLGNTRVLPESSSEFDAPRPWGTTMGDPAAGELSDAEDEEASSLGVLISASKVNRVLQEKKIQEESQKNDKDKIMALMQYLHIQHGEDPRAGCRAGESGRKTEVFSRFCRMKGAPLRLCLAKNNGIASETPLHGLLI